MATSAAPAYSWGRRILPRTAPLLPRIAAFALDLVALAAVTWLAWKAAGAVGFLPTGGTLESYGFLLVAELPIGLLYFTATEAATGRTPGKALVGLRVASIDGSKVRFYGALLRNLLRFLWVLPVGPVFVVLDAYLLATTEMDQRLGDLAAGTIVVDVVPAAA